MIVLRRLTFTLSHRMWDRTLSVEVVQRPPHPSHLVLDKDWEHSLTLEEKSVNLVSSFLLIKVSSTLSLSSLRLFSFYIHRKTNYLSIFRLSQGSLPVQNTPQLYLQDHEIFDGRRGSVSRIWGGSRRKDLKLLEGYNFTTSRTC